MTHSSSAIAVLYPNFFMGLVYNLVDNLVLHILTIY